MSPRPTTRGTLTILAAAALVALGVAAGALLWRTPPPAAPPASAPMADHSGMAPPQAPAARNVVVTLSPEMVTRAGIETERAVSGTATSDLRLPGIVQPNGYKQVAVTSLVAGRVTQVSAELGERVAAGQILATVYSPELAEAQTAYVAMHSELTAHDVNLSRTRRLASIGAASRQELEALDAEHSRMDAAVEAARSRLVLLGMPEARLDALILDHKVTTEVQVTAPAAGVVTERAANVGLNIDLATPLFTIVDLSTVWVVADLYERDFASVGVGSMATITTPAYPGLSVEGRVSYIDPQIQAQTRTAQLRIEIPNPGARLRFGMYVDVHVAGSGRPAVLVPQSAVQSIGDRRVVYVASAGEPGRYAERGVEVVEAGGDRAGIVSGVEAGELVVTEGAFFLRAERERTPVPAGAEHAGH